jgi:16S rRNA (cytosine1402-N4)-methyltransferase
LAILLDMTGTHVPVLAGELVDLTQPGPGDTAVDCTFGAGGHARLIAERLGPAGTLVCIDRDPAAEEHYDDFAREAPCETRFLRMDYADGLALLGDEGLAADLVYLDLGISSMQVDARERGFSYSYDAPLDMRMDPGQELDARAIVNEWDERRLAQLFRRYGEEPNARRIAREIVRRRRRAPIETTAELVGAIEAALPAAVRRSFGAGNPGRRVFQAVRIAVNEELDSLDRALPLACGSSAFWPTARAAVSAPRTSPSASAAASRRPSCSARVRWPPPPVRSSTTRGRGPGDSAPPAS